MRLLSLCAILGVIIVASVSPADAAVKAKPESYRAFLTQVSHGQVRTAVLVPRKKTLRARLKNGDRHLVRYKAAEKRQLLAVLHARKVHVAFAKPKGKHHNSAIRRRYIALAVVGLGLLASASWVFWRRRRSEGGRQGARNTLAEPSPAPKK